MEGAPEIAGIALFDGKKSVKSLNCFRSIVLNGRKTAKSLNAYRSVIMALSIWWHFIYSRPWQQRYKLYSWL